MHIEIERIVLQAVFDNKMVTNFVRAAAIMQLCKVLYIYDATAFQLCHACILYNSL